MQIHPGLGMYHAHPQNLLESIKIAIAMQQIMPSFKTERRNQTVDGLAHSVAALPQGLVISCGGNRHGISTRREHMKMQKLVSDLRKRGTVPDSLQHFTKN